MGGSHSKENKKQYLKSKKLRYRTDPEYRAKVIQKARERHERLKNDPLYQEIKALDKLIHNKRQKIDNYLGKIQLWEKSLIYATSKRERLKEERLIRDAKGEGFKSAPIRRKYRAATGRFKSRIVYPR